MMRLHWIGEHSTEDTVATMSVEGCHVDGVIGGVTPTESATVLYSIDTDATWATRVVRVEAGDRSLVLFADGHGAWTEGGDRPLDALDGAIDVDLSATPFTNTLPIWRLGLGIGESADIVTAHIAVPELTVVADPQRYTRLDERSYRYESLGSGFARDITVDDAGFVVDYPGLFRRA